MLLLSCFVVVFFFKQKTAYEMRISDWSSDVCSSDLFSWLSNTGHWPDIGGMVPGGFSANATEVEQEGLRLPPVKLYKAGVLDEEILSIILSNIRIADQRIGDIKAQIGRAHV